MNEEAQAIFDYLPIESESETLYIQHLWGAFEAIIEKDDPVRSFSILPFHLLFMLTVQYKLYRLSATYNKKYLFLLEKCRLSKEAKRLLKENPPLKNKDGIILSTSSVSNLSLIGEKYLFDFFEIIELEKEVIEEAKGLIDIRNNYAHANCNIEEDIDSKIDEYLKILNLIQLKCKNLNNFSQNWSLEIKEEGGTDEKSINEFFEQRFLNSQFSKKDFGDVIIYLLEGCNLDQFKFVANKGIDLSFKSTISALHNILSNNLDELKRNEARSILQENGEIEKYL
jgi:hypothetical protein